MLSSGIPWNMSLVFSVYIRACSRTKTILSTHLYIPLITFFLVMLYAPCLALFFKIVFLLLLFPPFLFRFFLIYPSPPPPPPPLRSLQLYILVPPLMKSLVPLEQLEESSGLRPTERRTSTASRHSVKKAFRHSAAKAVGQVKQKKSQQYLSPN